MKKLSTATWIYLALGLLAGLGYRELTKARDFPAGEYTQLGVANTHLLTLGFLVLLVVLLLEKVFELSRSHKLFTWFFCLYNAGVVITSGAMI